MSRKVCLDGGHGGRDPGAIGPTGVQEKVITLAVAKLVSSVLQGAGIEVYLTRDTDKHLGDTLTKDLSARAGIANQNKVDVFVSIHCNASNNRLARGCEVYTTRGKTMADSLAELIIKSLELSLPDLSFRKDFTDGDSDKESNFAVLSETDMPAILVELAFITNPTEEALLESVTFQKRASLAIAQGICDYLGVNIQHQVNDPNKPAIKTGNTVIEGVLLNGTTYAPVRLLAESLGKTVNWDGSTNTVTII